MNRLSTALLSASLLLGVIGVGAEHHLAGEQRARLAAQAAATSRLEAELRRAREALLQLQRELTAVEQENTQAHAAAAEAEAASSIRLWGNRITLLKRLLGELPGQSIPEVRLLTPVDWVQVARAHELDSPGDIRTALASLRTIGRKRLAPLLQEALKQYLAKSGGELPADILQLATFLSAPADVEMLRRYGLTRTGRVGAEDEYLLRETADADMILRVSLRSWDIGNNGDWTPAEGESKGDVISRAQAAINTAFEPPVLEGGKVTATPSLQNLMGLMEQATRQFEAAFGGDDALGTVLKDAARRHAAAQPDEPLKDLSQLLPYLEQREKLLALARPFFAQLAYMTDHQGKMPTDHAQLRRYLEQPFDAVRAFRTVKATFDGTYLTTNIALSAP